MPADNRRNSLPHRNSPGRRRPSCPPMRRSSPCPRRSREPWTQARRAAQGQKRASRRASHMLPSRRACRFPSAGARRKPTRRYTQARRRAAGESPRPGFLQKRSVPFAAWAWRGRARSRPRALSLPAQGAHRGTRPCPSSPRHSRPDGCRPSLRSACRPSARKASGFPIRRLSHGRRRLCHRCPEKTRLRRASRDRSPRP